VNVPEGYVIDELGLNDGADVREVGAEMVHGGDGSASPDGGLDLGQVLLGFVKELFSLAIAGRRLTFFSKGLGVRDKVEKAEALLALAGELNGLHRRDLIVARGVLSVHERVVMREVDLMMEEIGGLGEGFGYVAMASLMPAQSGLR
jgi:hypothetical protein